MKDIDSLEHTKWRCQYHIVFAPKYRRQVIYREIRTDIGQILRKLCEQKGVEIIEANTQSYCFYQNTTLNLREKLSVAAGLRVLPQQVLPAGGGGHPWRGLTQ